MGMVACGLWVYEAMRPVGMGPCGLWVWPWALSIPELSPNPNLVVIPRSGSCPRDGQVRDLVVTPNAKILMAGWEGTVVQARSRSQGGHQGHSQRRYANDCSPAPFKIATTGAMIPLRCSRCRITVQSQPAPSSIPDPSHNCTMRVAPNPNPNPNPTHCSMMRPAQSWKSLWCAIPPTNWSSRVSRTPPATPTLPQARS